MDGGPLMEPGEMDPMLHPKGGESDDDDDAFADANGRQSLPPSDSPSNVTLPSFPFPPPVAKLNLMASSLPLAKRGPLNSPRRSAHPELVGKSPKISDYNSWLLNVPSCLV